MVLVHKAGDIIPEIIRPLRERRTGAEELILPPQNCPACGSRAIRPAGEVAFRCENLNCPARLKESLVFLLPVMLWTLTVWAPSWLTNWSSAGQ